MPSFLVTGGAGFIGSSLVRQLLDEQCQTNINNHVIVLDKLTYAGKQENLPNHAQLHCYEGDVANINHLRMAFAKHRPEYWFHLAAESHVDNSIADSSPFFRSNVQGMYTLLEFAREVMDSTPNLKIVNVSTDEVYGPCLSGSFDEKAPLNPCSPYAASKAAADCLANAWHKTYGIPIITTRCCNNYGIRQHDEKFLPSMIRKAYYREPMPIYGDGLQIREWIHVDDHCYYLRKLMEFGTPGEIYNIGCGAHSAWTNQYTALEICRHVDMNWGGGSDRSGLITNVKDRPGHDVRYSVNSSKMLALLARHKISSVAREFEHGLGNLVVEKVLSLIEEEKS